MDWMDFLAQLFELVIYPVIGLIGTYLTYLIKLKIDDAKQKANNEKADKYLNMLESTINTAVLATTQTYVDALKAQGKFDAEAQKTALQLTYDAVMNILTEESQMYLNTCIADLEVYVINKIEARIKLSK